MRIRTIKPEFFHHEGLFEAEREAGLPLRVAFCGLWCAADREGRFKWEPRRLGIQILPYDQVDFSRVLDALATRGFLIKYACGNACFGAIPNFLKHQVVNNRESDSILPGPSDENCKTLSISEDFARVTHASPTREARDDHAGSGEGKGREGNKEGKGMEGDAPSSRRRFTPPTREELDLEAGKLGLPQQQVDLFVNYYASKGWKVGKSPMVSWKHALAGWKTRWEENRNGHSNPRSSTGRAAVVAERNATLGPNAAEHASEARARSRAIDEANAARFEATGLTPFDDDPTPVQGESAGAR